LFHLVKPSPWPFFLGITLFFFVSSLAFFIHRIFFGLLIFFFSIISLIFFVRQWFYDVEDEASLYGYHTLVVKEGLLNGFYLFLVSEGMLFFGFFWAFFHSALSPSIIFGVLWPLPNAFVAINCLGFPFYNTIILLISGATVTYAHYAAACGNHSEVLDALYLTIFLGCLFLISQFNEYFEIGYNINDSVYASSFFMLTGLHGMHVFIGVFLLYNCLQRFCLQDFTMKHYIGFICSIYYWHFVDVVWVALYFIIYVWGNWVIDISKIDLDKLF
jgi:cytochrome c oxidase subunit 3